MSQCILKFKFSVSAVRKYIPAAFAVVQALPGWVLQRFLLSINEQTLHTCRFLGFRRGVLSRRYQNSFLSFLSGCWRYGQHFPWLCRFYKKKFHVYKYSTKHFISCVKRHWAIGWIRYRWWNYGQWEHILFPFGTNNATIEFTQSMYLKVHACTRLRYSACTDLEPMQPWRSWKDQMLIDFWTTGIYLSSCLRPWQADETYPWCVWVNGRNTPQF